jgi:hypothetical protein
MCSRARQRHPNYRHDCVSPETTGVSRPDPGPLLFYREPSVLRPAPPDRGPRPVRARPPRVDGRTERRGARTPRVSCSRCQGPSSSSPPSASRRQCTPAPSVPSRLRWTCETPLEPIARPLPHRLRRRDGAAHRRRSGRRTAASKPSQGASTASLFRVGTGGWTRRTHASWANDHSTHTSASPMRARMKSGAGHDARQRAPVHAGSLTRGTS